MKLYNAAAPNPRKVRIFLAEKGIDVPRVDLDLQAGESRTPQFLAMNSLGGTPVLELDDGTVLTESTAICRYLEELHPDPPLFGRDALERAQVEMWNRRIELELFNTVGNVVQNTIEFFKTRRIQVPAFADAERQMAIRKLEWLDGEFADGRPFATGDRFSFADVTGMCAAMVTQFAGVEVPDSLKHVRGWFERLQGRPSWEA